MKTGSSDTAGFNYSSTAKRGHASGGDCDGVSDWSDQTGEELRHLVGNAIMEQAFERFEYKKVLSKGVHTIDGKKVEISKDLWDCVPKGKEAPLTIKDGKVLVDLERESAGISGTGSFVQTGGGSGEERTEGTAAVL